MNDKAYSVAVTSEILEEEAGLWCPECLLPSAVRVVLAVNFDGHPGMVHDWTECDNFHWQGE